MTPTRSSPPSPSAQQPTAPIIAEWESVEERIAAWARWADDEAALPDAELDAALVRLLKQIRQSL
jgi:hypothetical protein